MPATERPDLADLPAAGTSKGMVDEAGAIVYGWLRSGGDAASVRRPPSALRFSPRTPSSTGSRPSKPPSARPGLGRTGSEQAALILAGTARFLAAHTPTRRELAQVVRIATRLRRGEALYEEI